MGEVSSEKEPSKAWWAAHFDEGAWHVKWGFDSGDCFTVFPMLPKLAGEDYTERWERSFVPLRDADEMLCIESEVVEVLLRRVLEARFDSVLDVNNAEADPWRSLRFDWYCDNVYTAESCREICSLLRSAAEALARLPAETPVRLDEAGGIVTCETAPDGEAWWSPLGAAGARRDCGRIAELLEKVIASAEKQRALVSFSGP